MRVALRVAASLLLTIAVVWIGFEVWVSVTAGIGSEGILTTLILLLANVALNAWPAFVLIALAVGLAWLYRRSSDHAGAS